MFKRSRGLGLIVVIIVVCIVAGIALGNALLARQNAVTHKQITQSASGATVTILRAQDLFEPFILPLQPGTTVTWVNNDMVAHIFATTPEHSTLLNQQVFSLDVAPGKSVTVTFTRPGLYHYYETTLDTWNSTFSRVRARETKANYPLAMDGVVWVQGPIAGLPSSAVNFVLPGHDMFGAEFIAISSPGSVTWHNRDEDAHFVGLVSGWQAPINPADIGLHRLAGTNDVPGGESVTILFSTPGLYYYYCRNHGHVNEATHRAQVHQKGSEYPIPMEGFVLVI